MTKQVTTLFCSLSIILAALMTLAPIAHASAITERELDTIDSAAIEVGYLTAHDFYDSLKGISGDSAADKKDLQERLAQAKKVISDFQANIEKVDGRKGGCYWEVSAFLSYRTSTTFADGMRTYRQVELNHPGALQVLAKSNDLFILVARHTNSNFSRLYEGVLSMCKH